MVDCSPINGSEIFQLLQGTIPMGGRALTIYEKFTMRVILITHTAHQELLDTIKYCLPEGCPPIILADAIFKTPWFKAIENMGGLGMQSQRNVPLSIDGENRQRSSEWFASANSKAASLGEVYFSKKKQASLYCDTLQR